MLSDLNLGNILVVGRRITGLVDAENLGVGDRGIDVARLAFERFYLSRSGAAWLATGSLSTMLTLGHEICGLADGCRVGADQPPRMAQ